MKRSASEGQFRGYVLDIFFWLIALLIAFVLDGAVARSLDNHASYIKRELFLSPVFKAPGEFWVAIAAAVLVSIFHTLRWRAGALVIAAGALSGLINSVMKWVTGRTRPIVEVNPYHFDFFARGFAGMFDQKNLCFPSGHVALAFATAAGLAALVPRWRWTWYAAASLTAVERVAELAHYPSDAVAGAAVGIGSLVLVRRFFIYLAGKEAERERATIDAASPADPST